MRSAAPYVIADDRVKGANERPGVGFIGVGGRAQAHIGHVLDLKARGLCDTVAVCDVYGPRARAAAQTTGGKIYRNYKDLLADPGVDIVCIATPDRHHAPQAIDAVRAGKDVYCEKPLTHWSQMDLARQLGEETEKHKRIVQVGTQYVADDAYDEARKLIKEGIVGKIVHVQAGYFRRGDWGERMPIPDATAKPGPDLDWEQFLGDAPKVPFSVSRFFQWRLYWDYAGGPSTDLLVHVFTPIFRVLDLDFPRARAGRRRQLPVRPRGARPVQHHRRLRRRPDRGADELALELHADPGHPPRDRRRDPVGRHRALRPGHPHRAGQQGEEGSAHPLARGGRHAEAMGQLHRLREDPAAALQPHRHRRARPGPAEHGHPLAPREQGGQVRQGSGQDRARVTVGPHA